MDRERRARSRPRVSTTDANGEAKAVWKLGTGAGAQRATATADGLDPVEFVAFVDPNALPDRMPLRALDLATYDGSGQVVHPDVALPPFDGLDDRPRLAITPYPWGNANFENPSLFTGSGRDDVDAFRTGITNPVVKPTGGYLSDPDIVWLAERAEFWLYYRHVNDDNEILVTRIDQRRALEHAARRRARAEPSGGLADGGATIARTTG